MYLVTFKPAMLQVPQRERERAHSIPIFSCFFLESRQKSRPLSSFPSNVSCFLITSKSWLMMLLFIIMCTWLSDWNQQAHINLTFIVDNYESIEFSTDTTRYLQHGGRRLRVVDLSWGLREMHFGLKKTGVQLTWSYHVVARRSSWLVPPLLVQVLP